MSTQGNHDKTPAWAEELLKKHSASLRESAPGELEFKVDASADLKLAHRLLSDLYNRGFVHLADLTAYDEYPSSPRFFVVYELISLKEKKRCSVIASIADANPFIVTVVDLWKGANWLEREVFDMYGINFTGHPDLRRILLPPSFKGFPLRKDFIVDYRQEFEKLVLESQDGAFDPLGTTLVREPGSRS